MDTLQWPQEIVVKTIEESSCPKASLGSGGKISSRNTQKEEEEGKKYCPRCNSTNTKFCYYNNYSLTQPRYFCKTCRRYWTQGGSLRNIPVGGGSRKNKRSSSSSSSSSSNSKSLPNLVTHDPASNSSSNSTNQIPSNPNHDLNLPFPPNPSSCGGIRSFSDLIQFDTHKSFRVPFSTSVSSELVAAADNCSLPVSALELLTGISTTTRGSNNSSFMPIYNTAGFDPLGDLKPISLNFSLDGINGSNINEENTSGRFLFPFEDLKQVSANNDNRENEITEKGDSAEYWSGMLGGGNGSW